MESTCSRCKRTLPVQEFYRNTAKKDGCASWCRHCYREQYQGNSATYVASNRLRKYGVSAEQYDAMLASQDGVCAICGSTCGSGRSLAVDHDHVTGRVRALLCGNCNKGIGNMKDSPDLLMAAAAYILQYQSVLEGAL